MPNKDDLLELLDVEPHVAPGSPYSPYLIQDKDVKEAAIEDAPEAAKKGTKKGGKKGGGKKGC